MSVSTHLYAADSPTLTLNTALSTEGYFTASWSGLQADTGQLQVSNSADFSQASIYPITGEGSMTLSGYPDGIWFLRAGDGTRWAATVSLEVRHHSLARAAGFFTLGLLLFLVLLVVIVRGSSMKVKRD